MCNQSLLSGRKNDRQDFLGSLENNAGKTDYNPKTLTYEREDHGKRIWIRQDYFFADYFVIWGFPNLQISNQEVYLYTDRIDAG